jgi:hypothetical protein
MFFGDAVAHKQTSLSHSSLCFAMCFFNSLG